MVVQSSAIVPIEANIFDDDDEGWQDMPVVRDENDMALGLDEEDQKKYKYTPPAKKDPSATGTSNATGNILDVDYRGNEWRSKVDQQNEKDYTRLRMNEEDESDEVHLRTRYLFNDDSAMTPLGQMQATKDLLTEAQRIAYVGVSALTAKEMVAELKNLNRKELSNAIKDMELWALKIMGRLYYHMELATEEQKMIDSLAMHGIEAKDLVPSLMTTRTVANPEYDPAEALREVERQEAAAAEHLTSLEDSSEDIAATSSPTATPAGDASSPQPATQKSKQTTARVLEDTTTTTIPGVSTRLSNTEKDVTLDIRWTILCDLFLVLIADSVYDARSRVLLERVASKLGLGWLDVVRFERRVTEALEIQEEAERLESKDVIDLAKKNSKRRRMVMLGLATLGGGLVIGLSAGLLAPVIGAGLGLAFTTVGITGTTGFLAGVGGAAVITTGGVLTGSGIAAKGMAKRTQFVRTFDILPLHNNKRVNCILTVPGFITGKLDDVRLPFSVLDPVVGDVFSVLWEPEMITETGSALKILTGEVLTTLAQTALSATVMAALMGALQWPIVLTKLGYLIDNPWNNALDRAKSAGTILADILAHRHLGVRPITLIGFSLGARVIFYALLELAKQKQYGIVQDVIILGTTVTAPTRSWTQTRSVVSGRYVNGYARNDWVLNYLFRATSGGLNAVAGLRPIEGVPGIENIDVTDKIAGHMSYRTFMPLILDQLGFPVSSDFFDEPQEPDFEGDRIVVKEGEETAKKKSWFSSKKKTPAPPSLKTSRPPGTATFKRQHQRQSSSTTSTIIDDDLPPRLETPPPSYESEKSSKPGTPEPTGEITDEKVPASNLPKHAGFNFEAIKQVINSSSHQPSDQRIPAPAPIPAHLTSAPSVSHRPESAPPSIQEPPSPPTPKGRASFDSSFSDHSEPDRSEPIAGPSKKPSYHNFTSSFTKETSLSAQPGINGRASLPVLETPSTASWTTDAEETPSYNDFQSGDRPYYRSFGLGDANTSMGSSSRGFGAAGSIGSIPPDNPFASPSSVGLSFGGVDGSITYSQPSEVGYSAWELPPLSSSSGGIGVVSGGGGSTHPLQSKKSPSTLNLNPWQS